MGARARVEESRQLRSRWPSRERPAGDARVRRAVSRRPLRHPNPRNVYKVDDGEVQALDLMELKLVIGLDGNEIGGWEPPPVVCTFVATPSRVCRPLWRLTG